MFKNLINQKCPYCNHLMQISEISDPMFKLSDDQNYLIAYYPSGPDKFEFSIDLSSGQVYEQVNFLTGIKILVSSLGFECFNYQCSSKYSELWELKFSEHNDGLFYLESANVDVEELSLSIDDNNFIIRTFPIHNYSIINSTNQSKQEININNTWYIDLKQPIEEIIKKIETIITFQ